jgi:hypothetical protein
MNSNKMISSANEKDSKKTFSSPLLPHHVKAYSLSSPKEAIKVCWQ